MSIVFGVERFEGYVFDRKIFIDTDHKPLESIIKIMLSAPKRLQRTLLRLQKFDSEVSYRKGTEMHIKQGWSESRADVPLKLQEYFPFREEFSIQDDVVLEGEQIIVPSTPRQCMID